MTTGRPRPDEARHPIGVASTRTGVGQDVLRAWERRYGAVVPERTSTGRRLYSDADLKRLGLLRRLVEAGRRISDIARQPDTVLQALAEEDHRAGGGAKASEAIAPASSLDAALDAATKLDKERLERVLAEASLSMSAPELRNELLVPLLRELGERWRRGDARIVHEHLATTLVRKFVQGMQDRPRNEKRPRVILSTPSGQRHELGALLAAVAAEEVGWEAIYLGADLPAEEIALAARALDARAVALSLVYRDGESRLVDELRTLRRALDPAVAIMVGGRAVEALRPLAEETEVDVLEEFAEFQSRLESLVVVAGE